MEHQSFALGPVVPFISDDWPAMMREMGTNLMHHSGLDFNFKFETVISNRFDGADMGDRAEWISTDVVTEGAWRAGVEDGDSLRSR